MDLTRVLAQLRQELDHIDAAIQSLERLQAKVIRRGRPSRTLLDLRKQLKTATRRATSNRRHL